MAHTAYPKVDKRMPHAAPLWGASPLGNAPEDGMIDPATGLPTNEAVSAALIGMAASSLNGAAVGGVAAGSWEGAGVGAALTAVGWSGFTLASSWASIGPKTKAALGLGAIISGGLLTFLLVRRSKGPST